MSSSISTTATIVDSTGVRALKDASDLRQPIAGGAGLLVALLTWTGVLCYFTGRDRAAGGIAGVTILALLSVRIAVVAP